MYIDFWSNSSDYYAVDIEADSLNPTRVWVVCWENIRSGEKGHATSYEDIRNFFESTKGSYYVGHNFLKYDAPALNRLVGTRIAVSRIIDTLILSTLYNPSIPDGHSLDAWGKRLGDHKLSFTDYSCYSSAMLEYCQQDTSLTANLYRRITRVLTKIGFSEKTCEIQHKITAILERQHKNGFYFNHSTALDLLHRLRTLEDELAESVRRAFPAKRVLVAVRRMCKKDGSPTKLFIQDQDRYIVEPDSDSGTYAAYEDIQFNLGSPQQRVEKLLNLGWENYPDEVTKTGNPKPFDKGDLVPSLQLFLEENDVPEVRLIAQWMAINGRGNMVNTWLENYNDDSHCIHGKIYVADTLRFRHQAPNTANVPGVRKDKDNRILYGLDGFYTYESRDLWCSRPGRVLVGTDAAGLELRMLAHFLNRPDFTRQVVEGDPHQYNADLAGVSRSHAKTLL